MKLKGMIDLDIPVNQQYIIRTESSIRYHLGLIDKNQHVKNIIKALKCTIPYEKIVYNGNLFITQEECMFVNSLISSRSNYVDCKKTEFIEYVYKNCSENNHEWMYDVFMGQFVDSWYSYQFRYCSVNNSGYLLLFESEYISLEYTLTE